MAGGTKLGLGLASLILATALRTWAAGPYGLSWSTVDGGGASFSTSGSTTLGGTVGQHDAGVISGGSFQVAGGFWSATTSAIQPTATPGGSTFTPTPTRTPGGVRVPASGSGDLTPLVLVAVLGVLGRAFRKRSSRLRLSAPSRHHSRSS
jgi:hypothetical protein